MKIHRRYIVAGIVLVLALVPYVMHLRAKHALTSYKNRLLASGERLSISDLMPPFVSVESNSVPSFLAASGQLRVSNKMLDENGPPAMPMTAPGKAIVIWREPDVRDNSSTNSWEAIETAIEKYRPALEDLQDLIDHPALDFHLDYRAGPAMLLPHLAPLKQASQRLTAATLCDLRKGNTSFAITNVRVMLAISKGMSDERLIISQLVRAAVVQIAMAANWSVLQATNLDEAGLAALQQDWAQLQFVAPAENALRMERAMTEETLVKMRNSNAEYRQYTGMVFGSSGSGGTPSGDWFDRVGQVARDAAQNTGRRALQVLWQNGWSYQDELKMLKGDQVLLDGIRSFKSGQPFHQVLHWQSEQLAALGFQSRSDDAMMLSSQDLRSLFTGSVMSLERFMTRIVQAEVARQFAETAIALKRYQMRQGCYPSNLAALVPDFLPAVPRDPLDSKPLRYQLKPDGGILLYSVGEDGEDNGGDPTPVPPVTRSTQVRWQAGKDFVWPQPASPEEIADFYSKLFPHKPGK